MRHSAAVNVPSQSEWLNRGTIGSVIPDQDFLPQVFSVASIYSRRAWLAVLAGTGLRIGEALGLRVEDVSPDGSLVRVRQKAWKSEIHDFLKTENANREIDLHSSLAALLRQQIADRKDGLVFRSKTGKPLSQRNILSRELHPILKELNWKDAESGTTKAGFHAFRCFRNTYLRNYTRTPDGIIHFWMGHAGEGMSDLYDKVRRDIRHRKEAAENAGLGFDLPTS